MLGHIEESSIKERNDWDEKYKQSASFPQMKPIQCNLDDIVMIAYDFKHGEDETKSRVCYLAKCVYDTGNFRGFHFYDNDHRDDKMDTNDTFTDQDTHEVYMVKRGNAVAKAAAKTTAKEINAKIQNNLSDIVEETKELKKTMDEMKQMIKTMKSEDEKNGAEFKKLTTEVRKLKAPPAAQHPNPAAQGTWRAPLNQAQPNQAPLNQQGYTSQFNWMQPNAIHPNQPQPLPPPRHLQYPTTIAQNTQAVISGVPYKKDENPRKLIDRIIKSKNLDHYIVGMVNENAINPNDYTCKRAVKEGTEPDENRPPPVIIVTFTTRDKKLRFITKKGDFTDWTVEHVCPELATSTNKDNGIFIRENLTPEQRKLFYLTRQYTNKKVDADGKEAVDGEKLYRYTWTKHGVIYIKKTEDARAIRIDTEEDLANLQNQDA